jgi:hypothetical protein
MADLHRSAALRIVAGCLLACLLIAGVSACRGRHKALEIPEPRFIAVHRYVREALSAYHAKDRQRLTIAFTRLEELNGQPGVLTGEKLRALDLSSGGRYLVAVTGATMGGSRVLVFEAASANLLLGVNGYGASISPDDRWLACLQHRYATPEPGADVGSYEALMLVDLGRVRGSSPDDAEVFRTVITDPESRLMNARAEFTGTETIRLVREKPPLEEEYTFTGQRVKKEGRRWKYLKLF